MAPNKQPANFVDMSGRRIGRLVVLARAGTDKRWNALWLCRCDCGKEVTHTGIRLRKSAVKSCGCLKKDYGRVARLTHGMCRRGKVHPLYRAWRAMQNRCNNSRMRGWEDYGGRGIRVCERWMNSFDEFLKDMGPTWQPGLSIDRVDNNGNYEGGNCRWATAREQALNRRPRRKP